MAIRYSGDCEVRVFFVRGVYRGRVRAPGWGANVALRPSDVDKLTDAGVRLKPGSPASYDRAALAMLVLAERKRDGLPVDIKRGTIKVRREFIAPCPT